MGLSTLAGCESWKTQITKVPQP